MTNAQEHAETLLQRLRVVADTATWQWQEPFVTGDGDSVIVFEWWRGKRNVTVFIDDNRATLFRVPSPASTAMMLCVDTVENCDEHHVMAYLQWMYSGDDRGQADGT